MKYIKRCLALLMACVMTAVLVQPTTWAKYTTSASQNVNFTVNTNRATYTIDNILQQGDLTTLADNEEPLGFASESYGDMGNVEWEDQNLLTKTVAGQGYYCLDKRSTTYKNAWYWTQCQLTQGHQYYLRTSVKMVTNGTVVTFRLQRNTTTTSASNTINAASGKQGAWQLCSGILTAAYSGTGVNAGLRIGGGGTDSRFEYYISHLMLIDLTATFGAGNEPPKWWCDKYIPWVDEETGTKTVQWFPKASKSALDTAFHNGSAGYYAASNRKNVATVNANGSVTFSGSDTDVNSTSLGNPSMS